MQSCRRTWAATLVLLLAAGHACAHEPQVTFALKDGFVEFTIRKDGKPVADAVLQIIDERGKNFAEGETGPEGTTAFPLPKGASLIVEIKIGKKTADPIRLFKTKSGVEPARVLLSYGLRPCCRSLLPGEVKAKPALPAKIDLIREANDDLERRNFRPLSASLEAMLGDRKYDPTPTQAHTLLLQQAPDFTLQDVDGKEWSLAKKLKDGPVVLVFYYGYHCNHCVSQLFALNKDLEKFRELGVQVVSISADAPELTRERFKQYGAFKFPVLSDAGNKIAEKYETYVASTKAGQDGDLVHGTFVITRQGRIAWTNRADGPFTENRTLLHEVARAEGRLPNKK